MHIVLFQPEIPQNTGNIVRTCRATRTKLTLVRPLGFSVSNRRLKRAGLDYWDEVEIDYVDSLDEVIGDTEQKVCFFSSKTTVPYSEATYTPGTILVFGSETEGLPGNLFEERPEDFYTIPMSDGARCLNLATSAGIVLYEAQRQQNFTFA